MEIQQAIVIKTWSSNSGDALSWRGERGYLWSNTKNRKCSLVLGDTFTFLGLTPLLLRLG